MPKVTVLLPSQGPACFPCAFRVMIWHPVSVTDVPNPKPAKSTCKYLAFVVKHAHTNAHRKKVDNE